MRDCFGRKARSGHTVYNLSILLFKSSDRHHRDNHTSDPTWLYAGISENTAVLDGLENALHSALTMTLSKNPTVAGNQQGREAPNIDPYETRHLTALQFGEPISKVDLARITDQAHETRRLLEYIEEGR